MRIRAFCESKIIYKIKERAFACSLFLIIFHQLKKIINLNFCLKAHFKKRCLDKYNKCNTIKPCPDQYVATVNLRGNFLEDDVITINNAEYSERDVHMIKHIKQKKIDTVALILESPHKDEYDTYGNPIGPAMNVVTGRNIRNNILDILSSINTSSLSTKVKILLVEAVSYQCSNGVTPINEIYRDDVFKYVWNHGGRKDLINRLKYYKPKMIINACTGLTKDIESDKSLNGLVQKAINDFDDSNSCLLYYTGHPCSCWFNKSNFHRYNKMQT